MNGSPKPSFEIIHMISAVLVELNAVFENCELAVQQLYVLAYIDSHGRMTRAGQKVLLRTTVTKILKEVFKCNDNKVSGWVNELLTLEFLGETTLSKDEKAKLFLVQKGRGKAVFIGKKGSAKLSFFVQQLIKVRRELTKKNSKLLKAPQTREYGPIASSLHFFLSAYQK